MEVEWLADSVSRMATASHPVRVKGNSRTEVLGAPPLTVEVAAYPPRGEVGGPGFQIADHEANRVPASVLAGCEAVDAFSDVLTTLPGIGPRDTLALYDGVWIVVMKGLKDGGEVDRDVDAAIGYTDAIIRQRLRAHAYAHPGSRSSLPWLHSLRHSLTEPHVEFNFRCPRADLGLLANSVPASPDGL